MKKQQKNFKKKLRNYKKIHYKKYQNLFNIKIQKNNLNLNYN